MKTFIILNLLLFPALLIAQAPTVVSFTPVRNSLNIEKKTNITVTFDQSIDESTFNNSTIRINGSLSGLHPATFSYNSGTFTATIDPITDFKVGELVSVTLTRGIKSTGGDSLANAHNWSFTVEVENPTTGTFVQSSTPAIEGYPYSVTAGDFDGDGDIDLAVADYNSNTVSILLNDSSGTFSRSSTPAVGNSPASVTSGDLDGDGDIDLAVANLNSNTVSILLNDGSGTFSQSSTTAVGNNPASITPGDLDGDRDIDLAVVNRGSNTVSILLNDGSGTFSRSSTPAAGNNPASITSGDLDGDGDIDLAVANYNSNTVSILLNDGGGTFTRISISTPGNYPFSITPGDLDGDRDIDLAVANLNSNTVSILLNDGSGTFSQSSTSATGNYPVSVTSGDLDGDGDIDLAVANLYSKTVSILKNVFSLTIISFSPARNALNITKSTNIIMTFDQSIGESTLNDTTIKINGSLSGLHPSTFSYNPGTFTATIDPITDFKVGELVSVIATREVKSTGGNSLAKAHSWGFTIEVENTTNGTFVQSSAPEVGSNPQSVTVGDFDKDGDIDLAVANFSSDTVSILLNNGGGAFIQSSTLSVGSGPISVAAGDFDGDGDIDLAVVNYNSLTVSILLNNGNGTFIESSTPVLGDLPYSVTTGDFNGDGDIDLAVANYNSVSILLNDGSGTFIESSTPITGSPYSAVTSGDLDGDGDIDLAVAKYSTVFILLNNGIGIFTQSYTISVGSELTSVTSGDLDGDGDIDLAVANYGYNTISILLNNGIGIFTQSSTTDVGDGPYSVTANDLDGDGDIDLAVANSNSNTHSILLNNGSGIFTQSSTLVMGINPYSVTGGDFDGDGDIDLATANNGSNTVSILRNLKFTAVITGQMYFDLDNSGAKDAGENGIPNWTITLSGTKTDTTITDASGNYLFYGLLPGSYTVSEILQIGWCCTTPSGGTHDIVLLGEDTSSGKDFGNYNCDFPHITSIKDIPDDQGGKIRLTWQKSRLDTLGASPQITSYGVWRKIQPVLGKRSSYGSEKIMNDTLGVMYDFVTNVPAVQSPYYNTVAPTLEDSSASGIPSFIFLVTAHTADPNLFFISQPDSGYSVDNLPPLGLLAYGITPLPAGRIQLYWAHNRTDHDVSHYAAYRSTSSGFTIGPETFIGTTRDSVYIDSSTTMGQTYYYRLTAVDIHDNESVPTEELTATAVSIDLAPSIPTVFSLEQNFPNPFNPTTTIKYAIPDAGTQHAVSLRIFDLLGREVITLVNENKPAGYYQVEWHANVASGMYFYRLEVVSTSDPNDRFVDTKKMLLLK